MPGRTNIRKASATRLALLAILAAAGTALASPADKPNDPRVEALRNAVAAGGMSAEQARAVYDATIFPGSTAQARIDAAFKATAERVAAALENGRINQADADAKLEAARQAQADQQHTAFAIEVLGLPPVEARLAAAGARFEALVAAGKLTPEEAKAKLAAIKRESAEREKLDVVAAARIREAVAAGKMTPEEGRRKMQAVRESLAAGAAKRPSPEELDKITSELREAVQAGKLTAEEARAKLTALRAQASPGDKAPARPDWESIKRRIEGAVERGDLTREEADAKYRELRERAAKEHPDR